MKQELEQARQQLDALTQAAPDGAQAAPALPPWATVIISVLRVILDNLPAGAPAKP